MPKSAILERIKARGLGGASPVDLVAVGFSRREQDVDSGLQAALEFVKSGQRLQSLLDPAGEEIERTFGLDGYEAIRALALLELGRRTANAGKGPVDSINRAEDVFLLLKDELRDKRHMAFHALDDELIDGQQ